MVISQLLNIVIDESIDYEDCSQEGGQVKNRRLNKEARAVQLISHLTLQVLHLSH